MPDFKRGEVYYIRPYSTIGSEQQGGRPAVIVSNNAINSTSTVLEVCYLTLKEKKPLPTHVFVNRGACHNSTILCEQITSVSVDRVSDYLCRLPDDVLDSVDIALLHSLDIRPENVTHTPDPIEDVGECVYEEEEPVDYDEFIRLQERATLYEALYTELLGRVLGEKR